MGGNYFVQQKVPDTIKDSKVVSDKTKSGTKVDEGQIM